LLHPSAAYLLVSHGSRDPRPQIEMQYLVKLVAQRLQQSSVGDSDRPLVEAAVLELAQPLHQQIQQFAEQVLAVGGRQLHIVPMFLLPGVHVMEDIPAEVAIAQQRLGDAIALKICPYLGSYAHLSEVWLERVSKASDPQVKRILLGHGSRRVGGNQPMEAIALQLNALPAYWSVSPSLIDQVNHLVSQGFTQIEILPYFLFAGGITDAIAQAIQDIQQQLGVHLRWIPPQGATESLARFVVDAIADPNAALNTVRAMAKP
jgi:sirohydrochlorin ferrochelatase